MLGKILAGLVIMAIMAVGIFVGGWVLFVGGIAQVVNSCTPVVSGVGIGIGLFKIVLAGVVGNIVAIAAWAVGIGYFTKL